MSKRVQLRRGTTAETNTFTGAVGEVTVDTDKKTVVVHDGVTAGGTPLARVSEVHSLVPQATYTQQGVVRQATGTEVTNKSNVNAYVTPANALSITNTSNAATATKLVTARTINGVAFDGTANITIADSTKLPTTGGTIAGPLTVNGLLTTNGGFKGSYLAIDNRTLKPNETVKGGLEGYFTSQGGLTGATADTAYGDLLVMNSYHDSSGGNANALFFAKGGKSIFHYQAAQAATSWGSASQLAYVTDNVASATKLQTARTIGGVSFDGTTNIDLPGVNTAGNQNTSGNAATATQLSTASGNAPSFSARAWVNFNGTGTVAIRGSGNVSSVTDNGVGDYTINFTTALQDIDYNLNVTGNSVSNGTNFTYLTEHISGRVLSRTTNGVRVLSIASGGGAGGATDHLTVNVAVFR